MRRFLWILLVFSLMFIISTCTTPPEITVENDSLTINVQGYEESCVTPYTILFNVAGQWHEGTFLPYQGPHYLDSQYIDLPWINEGCDVVGICDPFRERTISISEISYENIGWIEHEPGQNVRAFKTLPPTDEIQVRLAYYADADCQRSVEYQTTLSLAP